MSILSSIWRWLNDAPSPALPKYQGLMAEMLPIAIGMWKKGKSVDEISIFLVQYLAVSTMLNEKQAIGAVSAFMEQFLKIVKTHDLFPKGLTDGT
jgi:hypothetical protein